MSPKDKLLKKLLSLSKTFTFEEAETLLSYFSFSRCKKGKTSGSRVEFVNDITGTKILLHRPHPRKELLEYQMKLLIQQLESEGLI